MKTTGWLFDAYTLGDRMVFWMIKQEDGTPIRLEEPWTHSLYVAADNESDLKNIINRKEEFEEVVKSFEFVQKKETFSNPSPSTVLRIGLVDSRKAAILAEKIWMSGSFGQYRLYNVDLLPAQAYFYEHELFPLAFCTVSETSKGLQWKVEDDVWKTDYALPDFRSVRLEIQLQKKAGKLVKFTDCMKGLSITKGDGEVIEIQHESEADIIHELISTIKKLDPDFIFLEDGDTFGFSYLIGRAEENGMDLMLNREKNIKVSRPSYEGASYTSYGKVHFKPAAIPLLGRIHCDFENSFIWNESGMHGLYEIARICRMPLHTAFRASIGKCLSSLQFYHATINECLIPWKPTEAEHFKTLEDLLLADRGGLILVPKIGVHEKVAEFDFASLYPNIMSKRNVSAETISCECCSKDSSDRKVPELGFHICKERKGIVPRALEIVIKKRADYKRLCKAAKDKDDKNAYVIYDARQNVLKWINVTSFGYLGFNNAKFGRIDSHQAVCAFDRETLMKAVKTAESQSYRILHGIVDSLWVQKRGADIEDYLDLKERIETATGFEISFEGEYKWIVFLASKRKDWQQPVPNRYFGVFNDGTLKIRGIEARRHDAPPLFAKFQIEILNIMTRGDDAAEVKAMMPEVQAVFDNYSKTIKDGHVPLEDLVFTKALSKDADQLEQKDTVEKGAVDSLARAGKSLKAGQSLRYIVTGNERRKGKRSVPVELFDDRTTYDAEWYVRKMAEVGNSVTEPFGYRCLCRFDLNHYHF